MTVLDSIAQAESTATYAAALRRLERRAMLEYRSGHPIRARIAARLARHVATARLRNEIGADPDAWERVATPTIDPYDGGRNER